MEAKVRTEGEVTIISIQGYLDIENAQTFRSRCVKQLGGRKLVFNLEKASFVGSTGVQPFLEAVKALSQCSGHGLKLTNVRIEFRRILQNMEIQNMEIHDSESAAIASFSRPKEIPNIQEQVIPAVGISAAFAQEDSWEEELDQENASESVRPNTEA